MLNPSNPLRLHQRDTQTTTPKMSLPSHFTLNTGAKIPAVGFGTWQAPANEVEAAVKQALECGYRHLDCAAIYRNEAAVGAGIKASGVPREDIFITSKLWNNKHKAVDVEAALDQSLKDLGTSYLDLYLVHWPTAFKPGDKLFPLDPNGVFELADIDPAECYTELEKIAKSGKVKAIGICNFNIRRLKDLLEKTTVVPAVNQIEAHPYIQQPELKEFCESKGILIQAYSPLGNNQQNVPKTVDDPAVQKLAKDNGMDAGQMLYSWAVQRGTIVLPKSVTPSRIKSNLEVKHLSKETFEALNGLERHLRFNTCKNWGDDIFDEFGEEGARQNALDAAESNKEKFTV